jgi:glycosyltransferase involved in cell wall biosynthesis
MKLLFVTRYVDHVLLAFLRVLADDVSLHVVYDFDNGWNTRLADAGVATKRLIPRSRFDKTFQTKLEQLYLEEPWDLIQSFHGNAQLANVIRWNRRGIPIVAYRGRIGHLKFRESPAAYWSVRNPSLATVVVNSTAVASYLNGFRLLRPKKVELIPTGVNVEWIAEQARPAYGLRSRLELNADSFIVLSMGSLRPVKRFEVIAAAAKSLESQGIHFVHVGDSFGWEKKRRGANLHFVGFEANPFPVIAEADVFASASRDEAFGRANVEAMACGKPVIGPRAGGTLDQVQDGVSGSLFTPNDAADLASRILSYKRDPALVASHGTQALERVRTYFSTSAMANAYLGVYRKIVAEVQTGGRS